MEAKNGLIRTKTIVEHVPRSVAGQAVEPVHITLNLSFDRYPISQNSIVAINFQEKTLKRIETMTFFELLFF